MPTGRGSDLSIPTRPHHCEPASARRSRAARTVLAALGVPTFLRTERRPTVLAASGYLWVTILSAFAGCLGGACFAGRIGRRATLLVFAAGSCAIVLPDTMTPLSDGVVAAFLLPETRGKALTA